MTANGDSRLAQPLDLLGDYPRFETWYSGLIESLLEPARITFVRVLQEVLDDGLSDNDRLRIRISGSRIKHPTRLWTKLQREKYVDRVRRLEDVPDVIDDLVGVRITCNNLSDIETVRKVLVTLPAFEVDEPMETGLCLEPQSETDYNANPKDTGYRAYHINLRTLIQGASEWRHARCELQVRTLLQDSWGDLTHEDTYKPGSTLPQLATQLARRIADLLSAVDDLAQDLRNELDQMSLQGDADPDSLVEDSLPKRVDSQESTTSEFQAPEHELRLALVSETRRVVSELTAAASLAELAWKVQSNFGREVTLTWGGYHTFKALLLKAVPDANIVNIGPGYLVPPGQAAPADSTAAPDAASEPGVPPVLQRLRATDKALPAVPAEKMARILSVVVFVLSADAWDGAEISQPVGIRELNKLTRLGRDIAEERGLLLSRQPLDYVLKALYFSGNLREGLSVDEVCGILSSWLFSRAAMLGLVVDSQKDRDEIDSWLESAASVAEDRL